MLGIILYTFTILFIYSDILKNILQNVYRKLKNIYYLLSLDCKVGVILEFLLMIYVLFKEHESEILNFLCTL